MAVMFCQSMRPPQERIERLNWKVELSRVALWAAVVLVLMALNIMMSEVEVAPPSFFLEILSLRR